MSKFFDDAKKVLKKGFSFSKVKAEEYGKIGKATGEIVLLKQKLSRTYGDLGETVRPLIEKDQKSALAQNEAVKSILKKLSDIEKTIKEKEKDIGAAKADAQEKVKKQKEAERLSQD